MRFSALNPAHKILYSARPRQITNKSSKSTRCHSNLYYFTYQNSYCIAMKLPQTFTNIITKRRFSSVVKANLVSLEYADLVAGKDLTKEIEQGLLSNLIFDTKQIK